jgi:hypothetical protein
MWTFFVNFVKNWNKDYMFKIGLNKFIENSSEAHNLLYSL